MAKPADPRPDDVPTQLTPDEWQQYKDIQWAQNDPDVRRQYPDKVIAAHLGKVVAAGDSLVSVFEEAVRSGLPPTQIALTTIFGPETLLKGCPR